MNFAIELKKGPAASNTYLSINGINMYQLTLDWSYDGIYFQKINEDWTILSMGPLTPRNEIYKLDSRDKIEKFKQMSEYTIQNLKGYSENSDQALNILESIANGL